jgi:hypothetical protein
MFRLVSLACPYRVALIHSLDGELGICSVHNFDNKSCRLVFKSMLCVCIDNNNNNNKSSLLDHCYHNTLAASSSKARLVFARLLLR